MKENYNLKIVVLYIAMFFGILGGGMSTVYGQSTLSEDEFWDNWGDEDRDEIPEVRIGASHCDLYPEDCLDDCDLGSPNYDSCDCDGLECPDSGDCDDPYSIEYPCDSGDCNDPNSTEYPCDSGDCNDPDSIEYPCDPVDNDGDGTPEDSDCDDNDGSVQSLNSCGECAEEPAEGCEGEGDCKEGEEDKGCGCGEPEPIDNVCGKGPCDKANDLNNPSEIDNLDDVIDDLSIFASSEQNEMSYLKTIGSGGDIDEFFNRGNEGEHFNETSFEGKLVSFGHNHFEGGESTFTTDDILQLYSLFKKNHIYDVDTFNYFLTTYEGTTYTISIDNVDLFTAYGDKYFQTNQDFKDYNQVYHINFFAGKVNGNDILAREAAMLEHLKGSGLSMYKRNIETKKWKLKKSGKNYKIEEPCEE